MTLTNQIKDELAHALHAHIVLLKHIDYVDSNSQEGVYFIIKSMGVMLERIPEALISEDEEDLYYAAFQYYNLLSELKLNLQLSYPQLSLNGFDLSYFPDSYVTELNTWWEQKTGLPVDLPSKQTIHVPN